MAFCVRPLRALEEAFGRDSCLQPRFEGESRLTAAAHQGLARGLASRGSAWRGGCRRFRVSRGRISGVNEKPWRPRQGAPAAREGESPVCRRARPERPVQHAHRRVPLCPAANGPRLSARTQGATRPPTQGDPRRARRSLREVRQARRRRVWALTAGVGDDGSPLCVQPEPTICTNRTNTFASTSCGLKL